MSNFSFLQSEWGFLHEAAHRAERAVYSDPRTACFYARRGLELAVAWLYAHDKAFKQPYQDTLSAFIFEPSFRAQVGDALFTKAKLIKDLGNLAVHGNKKMLETDALSATRELFHFCYWIARNYGRTARPAPGLAFAPGLLPKASDTPALTQPQLQKLSDQLADRNEALATLRNEKAELDAELQRLRAEVAAAKKANALEPDTHDYSEAETRKTYIDLLLREAGWTLDPAKNFEIEVTGMPNNEGKGYVDYVLWGDDGKPLMLVESKRTTRDPRVGQQQAKLYADCLEQTHGQRPIIFYSNGYEHWLWDDKSYPPRAVQGFYKKQELELLIQRRSSRKKLAEAVINQAIIERYYQTRAVRRVGETLEVDNQRKSLLVMATGSGKTRTVIALADVLMRSNWAKRVLFLADRVALVNQAVNAFKTHLPDAAPVNLVTEKNTDGRVYVSTYPTMMGLIDEAQDGQRRFGVGHFDLIVIDEAHRSVYQKYRAIFNYFDSLLVGLTATPKDEIDKNTYGLFDLESGVPTDAYTLEQAIADGHLVEPIPISVPMKFQREGIRYSDLSDDEKEQWDALDWNDEGTIPDEVDPAELNQWLFNTDTVDKVLEVLMTKGHKVAGGDRLGKTIIFAKNNAHAEFIAERFNINYPQYKGHFARVVTYKTEYAQSLIDDFSKKDKMPHIAISVDMLDAGIDVPEVVNLVFFKMVRSKTKFWQMVGRGTRLCKDLFGPGEDKQNFYIFDFCGNLEFFSQNPEFAEGASTEPLSTRLFKARLQVILELDRKIQQLPGVAESDPSPYGDNLTDGQLRHDLATMLHEKVAAMNVDNFVVRPQRRYVEKFANAEAWQELGAEEVEELNTKVADLPSAVTDEDEEAKRFDMLVLRTQLAILQAKPDFASLREKIQRIAVELEAQIAIPAIKAEIVLIQAVTSDEWWEGVTVPMLETVRRRLRALIKLIPKAQKKIVYTDFEDEFGETSVIDLPQVTAGFNMSKFRDKARVFLKAHESHLSLQRLKRNQPLTQTDLDELEKMLLEAGGTPVLISEAKEQCHGLGLFVRSLVGLDREAAMQAFAEFISGTTASPNQIEFINLLVEELTQTGSVEPRRLFESPFTDVNAQGPLGVFHSAQVSQIVQVLEDIRHRAVA
ncbi:DEAD/DEAH box helicase family protein [Burkholderia gladioli]|uniref:DEAD/DEAH box helicase family protein n=4 Tax=Burkholderia gladioli TaxID=28095 RepID=UPI0022D05546|nr:DEAD/DEAH box helicase family protein [Burkholderia gladioli]MDA0575856.1 DEAD/DEAH box helicase family protein [Burkholderia gladioli]MDA0604097.1 DEAD/DEAH box helicase family protein [Burkholderia gladioli]